MEILPDAVDYGDAPSFVATGVRRIFFVSNHMVRVTFVRKDFGDDGIERFLVSGHIDWDIDDFRAAHATFLDVLPEVLREGPIKNRRTNRPEAH